jgi:hypothetical protein
MVNPIMEEYLRTNLENISMYKPGIVKIPGDDLKVNNTLTGINYLYPEKPVVRNVPELISNRTDINTNSVIGLYSPTATNISREEDLRITNSNINTNYTYLSKPIVKYVPELMSNRTDVGNYDTVVGPFKPEASGVDPNDDIVVKDINTFNSEIINKLNIGVSTGILENYTGVNRQNIKFYSPEIFNTGKDSDITVNPLDNIVRTNAFNKPIIGQLPNISEGRLDLIKTNYIGVFTPISKSKNIKEETLKEDNSNINLRSEKLSTPIVKYVPELMSPRDDVNVDESKVSLFTPKASGVDPNDDIVISNANSTKDVKEFKEPEIAVSYPSILALSSRLNYENIKYYSPDIFELPKDKINLDSIGLTTNVEKMVPPIAKYVPEINTPRDDIIVEDSKVNLYTPESTGVDPAEDLVTNGKQETKIRPVEQPTIRVTPSDDMEDIPVIKIRR